MTDQSRVLTMSVREFLRGGYKETAAPVVVVSGATVAGVWYPGTLAVALAPPTNVESRPLEPERRRLGGTAGNKPPPAPPPDMG